MFCLEYTRRLDLTKKLYDACKNNDLNKVKKLIRSGAIVREDNSRALRLASWQGNLEIFKYLIEQGADPKHANCECIFMICMQGYYNILLYLLEQKTVDIDLERWKEKAIKYTKTNIKEPHKIFNKNNLKNKKMILKILLCYNWYKENNLDITKTLSKELLTLRKLQTGL